MKICNLFKKQYEAHTKRAAAAAAALNVCGQFPAGPQAVRDEPRAGGSRSPFAFRQRVRAPGTGLKGDALSVQAQYAPVGDAHTRKSLV